MVDTINTLCLPRYGLGNYEHGQPDKLPTPGEAAALKDLSRAGKRLMGFCRTNLFKRLESSGFAFLQSVERHVLRNYIFLHAIEKKLPLPIGTQGAEMLDTDSNDEDADASNAAEDMFGEEEEKEKRRKGEEEREGTGNRGQGTAEESSSTLNSQLSTSLPLRTEAQFQQRAGEAYGQYQAQYKKRFKWLASTLFSPQLAMDLRADCLALLDVLGKCAQWDSNQDGKLGALRELLAKHRPNDKVIVFTQFADTARYLGEQLKARGIERLAVATGQVEDPTELARRFSPVSNDRGKTIKPEDELRVIIATDVLSEGQNLQDSFIVVNYDLPWAIIRLIQRAGRVDRIGQKAEEILCCSFLPAKGVEKIIHLRQRVRQRLAENAEVVGTDESFFEDDRKGKGLLDLYHEKAGVLDDNDDGEVDLASKAYQIWKNAVEANPGLKKIVEDMPTVVYSTKAHTPGASQPNGALVYLHTGQGNDALAWIDRNGKSVTESQYAILKAAACEPDTPALERQSNHHEMVESGIAHIVSEERTVGGQLGRPSGARFRTYERLKRYAEELRGGLFEMPELHRVIEDVYRYPLTQAASDRLNSNLRDGIGDEMLAQLAILLREEQRLSIVTEDQTIEPRIICSLGLSNH